MEELRLYDRLGPRARYAAQNSHRELNLKRLWLDFLQRQPIDGDGCRQVPDLSSPAGDAAFAAYIEEKHIKPATGLSIDDLALTNRRRIL